LGRFWPQQLLLKQQSKITKDFLMTKFGKTLAVISLLCAGISSAASAQAVNQQASSPCSAEAEKAKWVALRMVLTEKITQSKSFMNKVGAGMSRYAPLWAGIVGMVGMGAMKWYKRYLANFSFLTDEYSDNGLSDRGVGEIGGASLNSDNERPSQPSHTDFSFSVSKDSSAPRETLQPLSSQRSWFNKCIKKPAKKLIPDCYGMSFLLPATVVYALCKTCGAYLESTSSRCLDVVNEIAGAWTTYKEYMPSVLCPQFEGYAQDLKKNGTLTTIDKNGARQLIEAILAMSLIVEAAN
jgi:hypothetical protein